MIKRHLDFFNEVDIFSFYTYITFLAFNTFCREKDTILFIDIFKFFPEMEELFIFVNIFRDFFLLYNPFHKSRQAHNLPRYDIITL